MPDLLPTGTWSLPPLGGRLFAAYRIVWWSLLALAVGGVAFVMLGPATHPILLALRLAKSVVLIAVAAILYRRRGHDAVAAMLGLSFLLWTISSSVDLAAPTEASWPLLLDRLRFLPFALALLLFPDGLWQPRRTGPIAAAIVAVFALGVAEAAGILTTNLYLPLAIGCVLVALASLLARYRSQPLTVKQQLKWVPFGLVIGIGLILSARAGAALATDGSIPMTTRVLLEGLLQSGIVVIALGFLTSLLRFRLYDAEAAISRSAAYAGLTLALVGTFAASETFIQTFGERYFGAGIGDLSGGIAAAIAAVLLTPLHSRITRWAEQYFQRDLALLKKDLPDLLAALSAGSSTKQLAAAALPKIEQAVQSIRIALISDGKLVAVQAIGLASARKLLDGWMPPADAGAINRDDEAAFPLQMALRCPLGAVRAWLLLGPRPDGSFYGSDDIEALAAIGPHLQRALFQVAQREREERIRSASNREIRRELRQLGARLDALERRP